MESYYFINHIFRRHICCERILLFPGISLNSLVLKILSFWRSVQLREKLCYFMIMVLLAVLTSNPLLSFITMSWLTGKLDGNARWAHIFSKSTSIFLCSSYFALLVMNFDRYLATSYHIFHRTSVMKGRLLTLLVILIIVQVILISLFVNDFFVSYHLHCHSCNVVYQLQTVSSRQEKS
jgi:hypothetical protein